METHKPQWVDPLKPKDYNTVVITHGGCADGTACTAMFLRFSKVWSQMKVYFHFAYERDFVKDLRMPSLAGKTVFIADYSYPVEVLHKIASVAETLYLWDHHETAMKDLFVPVDATNLPASIHVRSDMYFDTTQECLAIFADPNLNSVARCKYLLNYSAGSDMVIPTTQNIIAQGVLRHIKKTRINVVFDMSICASEIVFRELCGMLIMEQGLITDPKLLLPPWWLQHIRDRDLYLWDKPNAIEGVSYHKDSRAFSSALYEMRISPDNLLLLESYSEKQIEDFYARGRVILVIEGRIIRAMCAKSEPVIFEGYHALFLNTPTFQTDAGNMLVSEEMSRILGKAWPQDPTFKPVIGIIGRYSIKEKCWYISLRGRETISPNLATIAKKYGGGGHPPASGFDHYGDIGEIVKPL